MPNLVINRRVLFKSTGPVFDAAAKAYFDALSPTPSLKFRIAVNNFIVSSKANGNWKFDAFYIHRAEFQQNARINMANPGLYTVTEVNSPTWAANTGYTFNGSTTYINTNYNPNTNGVFYTRDGCCMGARIETDTASGSIVDMGCGFTNNSSSGMWFGANAFSQMRFVRLNETVTLSSGTGVSTTSIGTWFGRRTSSSDESFHLNGTQILSTTSQNTTGVPNLNVYVGCVNNNGSAANFSNRRFSFSWAGSGEVNPVTFNTDLNTLIAALNA